MITKTIDRSEQPLSAGQRRGRRVTFAILGYKTVLWAAIIVAVIAGTVLLPVKDWLAEALEWTQGLGIWGPVVVVAFHIVACVFLLPGSVLTLGAGFLFKLFRGAIVVSIGSTLGACAAFWVGRTIARNWIAGKDVFVQKPASHNIFEGRKLVEAAAKYNRVVQATHGPRSNGALEPAFEYAWKGNLGKMLYVHGLNYRPRMSIGKVTGPQPILSSCDYDLWCGPAPTKPLMRKYLHYDWHWDWTTGNGDIGNMGIHHVDSCRWAVNQMELPKRVISIGGRFAYDDDGQTPNTLITLLDYDPVPILFEVRGLPKSKSVHDQKWSRNMDTYLGEKFGAVVHCENGYVLNGAAYDKKGELVKKFTSERISTKQNFIDVMRSRKTDDLYTDALDGHLSCGLLHMANISHRIGKETRPGQIRETIRGNKVFAKSFDRIAAHLEANGIDLSKTPATLGPMLEFDPRTEKFTGEFSKKANKLISRPYRKPFVVPERV